MLDSFTIFVVTTAFMLATGAVLGFMHSALPDELKPAAADWRLGTLLLAGSALLLASRGIRLVDWVIPIANGALLLGGTLYWRALRRYFGAPDQRWIYTPLAVAMVMLIYFLYAMPNFNARVFVVSSSAFVISFGSIYTLRRYSRGTTSAGAKVLSSVLWISALFAIVRIAYRGLDMWKNGASSDILLSTNFMQTLTPLIIAVTPIVGTTAFVLLLFERIRGDLHRAATTDALTELPNRRTVTARAESLFARAQSERAMLSVAVIDIDGFKQINDRFGHAEGDVVLKQIAGVLRATTRGEQIVGRQGGEEFLALLDGANATDAQAAAERLRAAVAATPIHLNERTSRKASEPIASRETRENIAPPLQVTVSIGVATLNAADASFTDLLRRADRALYAAKEAGRNCARSDCA